MPRPLAALCLGLVAAIGCADPGPAQDRTPGGEPGRVGGVAPGEVGAERVDMDPALLAAIDSALIDAIADSAFPGAALAVGRQGSLVRLRGYGSLDWVDRSPVDPTTLYDLASLTKVVGTTTATMILVDEGRLSLDDRVVDHLEGWAAGDPRKADVTVRQLLLHRAGLPAFRRWFLEIEGRDAYRAAIAAEPLEGTPGARTVYSDIGVMSLALLVEAVAEQRLDAFLSDRVFGPLGMADTGFLPPSDLRPRIAPTELDTLWRGELVRGRVHDENADAFGGIAGHAGLFSTAADLAVFADLMLRGGSVPACSLEGDEGRPCPRARTTDTRLFGPSTTATFTTRADSTSSRALGWDTPSGRSSAGDFFSASSFGHTGFTGTSIWLDPERELFVVLLTNRVNPTRENSRHVPLRRRVHDLAAQAVRDVPARTRSDASR